MIEVSAASISNEMTALFIQTMFLLSALKGVPSHSNLFGPY